MARGDGIMPKLEEEILQAMEARERASDLEATARAHSELEGAAAGWVEAMTVHPTEWARPLDTALITAVRRLCPDLRPRWLDDPRYDGWDDPTDPGERPAAKDGGDDA